MMNDTLFKGLFEAIFYGSGSSILKHQKDFNNDNTPLVKLNKCL